MRKFFFVAVALFCLSTHAENKFRVEKLKLGKAVLAVEIADTDPLRQQGLMNRTKLEDGKGMLFKFDDQRILNFWMKNTLIPLSIGFFDSQHKLVDMQDMEPAAVMDSRIPQYESRAPAQYALEVPKGWFKKNDIKLGQKFEIIKQAK